MRDLKFTLLEAPESLELKEADLLSSIDARWKIQKTLSRSDVDTNKCRLRLPRADVEAHILPLLDEEEMVQLLRGGLPVRVVDDDNDVVYEGMKLTFYNDGSCVLNGRWTQVFKNRHLQNNDKVGLYGDRYEKEFRFAVLDRARGC